MNAAVLLFAIGIKSIGVLGPITGSQDTAGQVDVEMSATVHLESSNPHVATVPESVFARGVTTFAVKTFAVKGPTDVTITARIGAESKSAILRVLPPKLFVGCDVPAKVSSFTPLKCKAFLDGLAPEDMPVSVSSDHQEILVAPSITISRGTNKTEFAVSARPVAQPVTGQVSVASGGVTKSQTITVMPIALEGFSFPGLIGWQRAQGGDHVGIAVKSLASAPGLAVTLSAQALGGGATPITFDHSTIHIGSGGKFADGGFSTRCVSQTMSVTVTASADFGGEHETVHTDFTVVGPRFEKLTPESMAVSNVGSGGQKQRITIRLQDCAGPSTSFDVAFSGDAHITVPARVQIPYGSRQQDFEFTIWPCPGQPPCGGHIDVANGRAIVIVRP